MTQGNDTEYSVRIDYAARRRERSLERSRSSRTRWGLIALAAAAAVLVVLVTAEALLGAGRIHRGVSISGIEVGGMPPARARSAIEATLGERASRPVELAYREKTWTIASEEIGLTFDLDKAVAKAMEVGRDESILISASERAKAWTRGIDVAAEPAVDSEKADVALDRVALDTDVAPVDATVEVNGGVASAVPGKDGLALDRPSTVSLLVREFTDEGDHEASAPVVTDEVAVTDEAAEDAAEIANAMLSDNVRVTYEEREWTFSPEEVGAWLAFRPIANPATSATGTAQTVLEPYVDVKLATKPVTKALGSGIGRPAKDATFKTNNGAVSIVPSQEGVGPDVEQLAQSLTDELKDSGSDRVVELHTDRTVPKLTTAKARGMGIRDRIAYYTTTYESGNRPRVNNIHLLGDSLNGTLIAPGDTFSFNEAAGQRTAEKGYQEANAIVNGKLVPQLGGGVCQVGTTVFNAVFESGLPVIERKNHSFYISHYPKGRDATVSWGGPDLKFKNDTDHWILVSVSYTSSSITVALYGTDPGYDVEAKVGEWTNMRPFPTENTKDPRLESGTKVVEDAGVTGRTIRVERFVTKDGKVVRTDTFVSNYKPKAQVVRVGTKNSSSKPTTSTP